MSTSQEHVCQCSKMSTFPEHVHVRSKMPTSPERDRVGSKKSTSQSVLKIIENDVNFTWHHWKHLWFFLLSKFLHVLTAMCKSELSLNLNHYMSDIFGHWCGHNIHPLRPGQDCNTLWDYLESLNTAPHVIRLSRSLPQLSCRYGV
jgi:hypothetical protein